MFESEADQTLTNVVTYVIDVVVSWARKAMHPTPWALIHESIEKLVALVKT